MRFAPQFVYISQWKFCSVTADEDKVKKISALLEHGGTMLARHHECGAPLFKYRGRVVCPVCDDPLGKGTERNTKGTVSTTEEVTVPASTTGLHDAELRKFLLDYAGIAAKQLSGGKDADTDALILSNIETALRCAAILR